MWRRGGKAFLYKKCGRQCWKLTPEVRKFIIRRLLAQRMARVVTSVPLAKDVAKEERGLY